MEGELGELFLAELVDMGFPHNRARKALVRTHLTGVEPALNWLIEHAEDPDLDLEEPEAGGAGPSHAAVGLASELVVGVPSDLPLVINPDDSQAAAAFSGVGECKVVLLVPTSLGMSPGKIGAQCAHAALGLYRLLLQRRVPWLSAWEEWGEKTVVLQVESGEDLLQLQQAAEQLQLPSYLVRDAGRTEVASGSATVLALGGVSDLVDRVTGHLKTL